MRTKWCKKKFLQVLQMGGLTLHHLIPMRISHPRGVRWAPARRNLVPRGNAAAAHAEAGRFPGQPLPRGPAPARTHHPVAMRPLKEGHLQRAGRDLFEAQAGGDRGLADVRGRTVYLDPDCA